jgi:hypothetical protein
MYDAPVIDQAFDWIAGTVGMRRIGVVFCTLVVLGAAVIRYPAAIGEANDTVAHNAALDYADREIAGGNGVVADQTAMYEARSLIPPGGTYRVVTGIKQPTFSDLTLPYIDSYATYFLLPRRPSRGAPWVLCYGCDAARYPGGKVVWKDDEGISIIKLPQ